MSCFTCHEAEMVSFREGSSAEVRCPKCGECLVRTVGEPIHEDQTVYGLFIRGGSVPKRVALSAVSKVVGCGHPQAKRITDAGEPLLFSGRATEVRGKSDLLERGGVAYRIEPDHPY